MRERYRSCFNNIRVGDCLLFGYADRWSWCRRELYCCFTKSFEVVAVFGTCVKAICHENGDDVFVDYIDFDIYCRRIIKKT